jgi:rhamnose transport system permease protein
MKHSRREVSVALAILALGAVLAVATPGYFSSANLRDLFLANLPVLLIALGATLVMLTGEIDVSVGSVFAVCSVIAGVAATWGFATLAAGVAACVAGAGFGAASGALVAYGGVPSIVVTLAAMVVLRDGLRWITQGAWIVDLPAGFQWLGATPSAYLAILGSLGVGLPIAIAWAMRNVAAGRAVYLTGSNKEAARLSGIETSLVTFSVFTAGGVLAGLAAFLNAVRFNQIPPNTGLGLEMKVIAAVVVGGTAITGGRGTVAGTLLGVILLGAIGPALTFLGVSAYWERALHGVIILTAVVIDAIRGRTARYLSTLHASRA